MAVMVRTFFVLLTGLLLVLALLLAAGRYLTWQLTDAQANAFLTPQGLQVQGLTARWRFLNPVVQVQQLRLGQSQLVGVAAELDWLESLVRRAPVLRHLSIQQGELELAYSVERNWHLAGMPEGPNQRDWFTTVYESDELRYTGDVNFTRGADSGRLQVNAALVNRGGAHRVDIQLADPECPAQCALRLRFDDREALWPLWYRELAATATTTGRGIKLPSPLLAGTSARLQNFQLRWDRTATRLGSGLAADAGIGAGVNFVLQVSEITAPGGLPFTIELAADGTSVGGVATARVHDVLLTQQNMDAPLALPPLWLQWTPEHVRLFAPKLALEPLTSFFVSTRVPDDKLKTWLAALNVRGNLLDARVHRSHQEGLVSYAAKFRDVAMQGYKGVPLLRGAHGSLGGHGRGVEFALASPDLTLGFPDQFLEPWRLQDFSGGLHLWRHQGVLRLVGSNIEGNFEHYQAPVPNRVDMNFAMALPPEHNAQTLSMQVQINQTSLPKAKTFLPTKLNPALRSWLVRGPQDGTLSRVDFAYLGHLRGNQGPQARRAALRARVTEAAVVYHESWPLVGDIAGALQLSGQRVHMDLEQAQTQDIRIGPSKVTVAGQGSNAVLQLAAEFDLAAGLNFVRRTPLAKTVSFVGPQWHGAGGVVGRGTISVPIRANSAANQDGTNGVSAKLNFALQQASLNLPEFRLPLANVVGNINFKTPNHVSASGVRGTLYGSPWRTDINTELGGVTSSANATNGSASGSRSANGKELRSQAVVFSVAGQMQPQGVYRLLDLQDPGIAQGASEFRALLRFPTQGATSSLQLASDMTGTALTLPGQLAKAVGESRGLSLQAQFTSSQTDIALRYPGLVGALQVQDGSIRRGALQLAALGAVATPMPQYDPAAEHLRLGGELRHFDIATAGAGGDGLLGQVPFAVESLAVAELTLGDTSLGAVSVDGSLRGNNYELALQGPQISGHLLSADAAPLVVRLDSLRLPAYDTPTPEITPKVTPEPTPDPLSPDMISQIPHADVVIEALWLGAEDFGRWQFGTQVESGDLVVDDLVATTKGLNIASKQLRWVGVSNRTEFVGSLTAGDLGEVLPLWGYAASLSTSAVNTEAHLGWQGSPLNIDLASVHGELSLRAREGRFLDVETGNSAQRIFSLLNFSAIAKRMSFDFSDVVGKGVSFDKLSARVALQQGELQFLEPMEVKGTGSSFKLDGQVNLLTGQLNNDMIVTLPVSKGLPWYAAYIAIANPLAGLGVLVGERVLRKPLEQFSSAKYHVSGTLDEPQLKLVNVFDNRMDGEPPEKGPDDVTGKVIPIAPPSVDATLGGNLPPGPPGYDGDGNLAVAPVGQDAAAYPDPHAARVPEQVAEPALTPQRDFESDTTAQ